MTNTDKIRREINLINDISVKYSISFDFSVEKVSAHWNNYIVYLITHSKLSNDTYRNRVFEGKPEAVLGYLKGVSDTIKFLQNKR